jgi:isoleucyl-tRNA synthetase
MAKKLKLKPVDPKQSFVEMEKKLLDYWYSKGIVEKYLRRNQKAKKKFSFLDGPITANNPMGVHHAWGRTYKDLWQRFYNMQGFSERFQNGFDEQGLWVEVEVEKELGFKNKKDIEKFGIDKFVNLCKERVRKFSQIQTEQSKRLGYFMNWGNSYHTSSDENNYAIWNFIKVCYQKGYLYKGRDSVPWCPRCGTAISQHEILTEEYKEITHETVFFKLPIRNKPNEYLLAWTTTPWTIPANVAVAVNPKEYYVSFKENNELFWVMENRLQVLEKGDPVERKRGRDLIGWEYDAPFDDIGLVKETLGNYIHRVVDGSSIVTETEGTGLLHVAPGAGAEDFQLGLKEKLPVIAPIEEDASYVSTMGIFAGKNAKSNPEIIIDHLKSKEKGKFLYATEKYKHRYPTCWRCKTELVWRVVDEWYIAMDKKDPDDKKGRTLRAEMIDVAKKINWIPKFGLDRELDWLKNMHDWLISKKRYWGLALPIWECNACGNFDVIGSKEELGEKATEGWDKFEGNSPHRPWIDNVKIKCAKCGQISSRIPDVGNPWLDAGIVPFSTMPKDWFPADFITESFPGQFKNWFYSLIAMSTVLKNENPFKTVLGFATLLDEKGEEMHKSKGNAIEFNEAADKIGVDVMRWMYATQNPQNNLLFGYHKADEVRRRFYLILWNVYSFFVTYANLNSWQPSAGQNTPHLLDKWIVSKLNSTIDTVTKSLEKYDSMSAANTIEYFVVVDISTWYVRRSRDRVEEALPTLFQILISTAKLLAPFMPFISEEIYMNLTDGESVHLADFPVADEKQTDKKLEDEMKAARLIVEAAHAKRKEAQIKVRQPLASLSYGGEKLPPGLESIIGDEINVKKVIFEKGAKTVKLETELTPQLQAEGEAREIIRQIQQARKEAGCALDEKVTVKLPAWPKSFESQIKKETLSDNLVKNSTLEIVRKAA